MLRQLSPVLFALIFIYVIPAHAHANLRRSEPSANVRVDTAPDALYLYFSEPLEAEFSRIELRNIEDEILDTAPAILSDDDASILIQPVEDLADGIYTVAWRVVSQTDGHLTRGSFPIIIGDVSFFAELSDIPVDDEIPVISSLIRWFNLLSLAWFAGSIAFLTFIWQESQFTQYTAVENRMRRIILAGWLGTGIATLLILVLQAQIASGEDWRAFFTILPQLIGGSRFGNLWIIRLILWSIAGIIIWKYSPQKPVSNSILLIIAGSILITQSLFSHASGSVDARSAVFADWMHLLAMSFWIGGLIQLLFVIPSMRKQLNDLAILVARFSNMARLSVMILVISGVYAAWLHIGTIEALLNTSYGLAMTVKLLLFSPLLLIGAINLLLTGQGLKNGKAIWSKRLQILVALEITLAILIIGAVGVMTAIAPARTTMALREAVPPPPQANPYFEMAIEDEMMIHFSIEPGTVGQNTFYVDLYDEAGSSVINDASLIRLRFENESDNSGQSELRPELQEDGRYTVSGANLSAEGDWQIRMTIQRPDEFDTVLDFEPSISLPEQPAIPDFDPAPSQSNRGFALLITGLAGTVSGLIFLFFQRPLRLKPLMMFNLGFTGASLLMLLNAGQLLLPESATIAPVIADNQAIQMSASSATERPYLLTQDGRVLQPGDDGTWSILAIDKVHIRAIYVENSRYLWAATDNGLYAFHDGQWMQVGEFPSQNIAPSHGYVYAMGTGGILRVGQSNIENDVRMLDIPEDDLTAQDFVMSGNHSHILLNGNALFLTSSLGLGWQSIDAPAKMLAVAIDDDGNLLAISDSALWRWRWTDEIWQNLRDLPSGNPTEILSVDNQLFLLTEYRLYQLQSDGWQVIDMPDVILDIDGQHPDTLWILDSQQTLWTFHQGEIQKIETLTVTD